LKAERRLRELEYRMLRIFGPKRDEVTREWRKLHIEELNDRLIISRRMRWAENVAC
jgi:hypothetical protein